MEKKKEVVSVPVQNDIEIQTRGPEQTFKRINRYEAICNQLFPDTMVDVKKVQNHHTVKKVTISDTSNVEEKKFSDVTVTSVRDKANSQDTRQEFTVHPSTATEDSVRNSIHLIVAMATEYVKANHTTECTISAGKREDYAILIAVGLLNNGITPLFEDTEFSKAQQAKIMQTAQQQATPSINRREVGETLQNWSQQSKSAKSTSSAEPPLAPQLEQPTLTTGRKAKKL